jgi:hypothetical protein
LFLGESKVMKNEKPETPESRKAKIEADHLVVLQEAARRQQRLL